MVMVESMLLIILMKNYSDGRDDDADSQDHYWNVKQRTPMVMK